MLFNLDLLCIIVLYGFQKNTILLADKQHSYFLDDFTGISTFRAFQLFKISVGFQVAYLHVNLSNVIGVILPVCNKQ